MMKIATWNVNSIRTRAEQVTDWLQENPVEVLCLQETKVVDKDFPKSPFEDLGYQLSISGQKAYNGVAILTRSPLEDVSTGFAPIIGDDATELDAQKRVISGRIGNIRVVDLYIPNGSSVGSEKYEYKLKWLDALQNYLKTILDKEKKICICGDFNIAPEDRDIYQPKTGQAHIMASDAERQALRAIADLGFFDAFRKFTDDGGYFSWWDYRRQGFQRNRGWRIDHHFLTKPLYDRAVGCTIDINPRRQTKPSDHAPVILEIS